MDNNQIDRVIKKLDLLLRLLAVDILGNIKTQKEKILKLSEFKFSPPQIAEILNVPLNSVHTTLSRARKQEEKTSKEVLSNDKQKDQ